MSKSHGKLSGYPKLLEWYQLHKEEPAVGQPVRLFIWTLCHALTLAPGPMTQTFTAAMRDFLARSRKPREDFQNVEDSFSSGGVAFFEVVSEIAEAAIGADQGAAFAALMREAADRTVLTPFRFLAAWTYLNVGAWEACIGECEKVTEPFAPIYTLQGQAYLEQGHPHEAVQLLEIALKISPREILAAFQLAKAHHVLGDFEATWRSLAICEELAPHSLEVACFKAMACLTLPGSDAARKREAWQGLYRQAKHLAAQPTLCAYLLRLALDLGDGEKFARVLQHVELPALKGDPAFIPHVAPILRKLHENGWRGEQLRFLEAITA